MFTTILSFFSKNLSSQESYLKVYNDAQALRNRYILPIEQLDINK
jgi:hypothetical protein